MVSFFFSTVTVLFTLKRVSREKSEYESLILLRRSEHLLGKIYLVLLKQKTKQSNFQSPMKMIRQLNDLKDLNSLSRKQ